MKTNRSTYTFNFSCDPNLVNNLIQSYLQANKYTLESKNGEQFYRAGDAMIEGYRYFNYLISGQTITIYAWLKGAFGEVTLEQNSLNIVAMNYRNSLNTLFQEISKLNSGANITGVINNVEQPQVVDSIQQAPVQQPQNTQSDFAQTFQNETTKKQEKLCEIGFWLSLFGLFASFFGVAYGVIVYIIDFYFASQGLKTRKRKKAIATIVLSIISILIIIFTLLSA